MSNGLFCFVFALLEASMLLVFLMNKVGEELNFGKLKLEEIFMVRARFSFVYLLLVVSVVI